MSRSIAVDACAGEGGATRGLMDAGYDVIAVDTDKNRLARNPARWKVCADALDVIPVLGPLVDLIWTGFPCQGYSAGTRAHRASGRYNGPPRLIAYGRELLEATGTPWVIENVAGARAELRSPVTLCGTQFGLWATDLDGSRVWMQRHRLIECSEPLMVPGPCRHPLPRSKGGPPCAGAYGAAQRTVAGAVARRGGYVPHASVQAALLGVDEGWMTQLGLRLCIPPVYAQFVGEQLIGARDLAVAS